MQYVVFFFLQSRIVVVENLPEDHSHQNVQKIFSVVGRSSLHVGRWHFVSSILENIKFMTVC